MRRFFLLLVCVVSASVLHAEMVTEQQALQTALQFVTHPSSRSNQGRRVNKESTTIVYTHKMPRSNRAAFYIVNVGDGAFVLVSADDMAHQVLGYSFSQHFPVGADGSIKLPPHIKSFFDDLAAQMEAAIDGEANGTTIVKRTNSRRINRKLPASVDPLITTTWDQGQYYNALCPEDANGPDGHVWAGCVATAMAQIVKYWGYPTYGRGTHGYSSNYGWLEVNFEASTFNYTQMPNALDAGSSQTQINAVATLMYQCGVAANMSYGSGESSSYDVDARAGLINFFRFSSNMSFAEKDFFTDDEWNDLLRENLAANHPVIYSGQSGNGGHSFVCDGYKDDDYYHFNFGWGGFFDGWYLTSAVDVNNTGYNSSQTALVGIVPDNTGNVILGQTTGNSTFTVSEPLEFYNLMGHNAYEGNNYGNLCDNTVIFVPADATKQMVVDVMDFEDQTVNIYNGTGMDEQLRSLVGGGDNDLSPVVSTANALTLNYTGNFYYAGFKLAVSQENGLRMVSNIASFVDNTTVHLTWTENGSATQWQIEYGIKGFESGKGTTYNTTTNSATFESLQKFTEYDFYIRSVSDNQYSPWNKITLMVEAPYWQDVVTSQPEGYVVDEATNTVEISTAEALAWWAEIESNRNVLLTADIDLSAYKWRPVESVGNVNGQGHVISNLYIIETTNDVGFLSDYYGTIENVGFDNIYVKGKNNRTGGLVGELRGTIRNCYIKNGVVDGGDYTGGLVGESDYGTVINCFVNVNASGARWASLLIGNTYQSVVRNCYAAGSFRQRAYCYNGGIVAYSDGGAISNCYSVEMPMGVIGYKGSTVINDTATFVKTDAGLTLLTPVVFDEQPVTDLLTALNNWVCNYNDAAINTWVADQNGVNEGYPVFGSKHVVQCPNVSDVVIQNVKTGDKNGVSVGWTENGTATKWQIRYRRHDVPDATYTYVTVTNNPATIQTIPLGYVYDFNVQTIGEGELKSGWSETQSLIVDLPYWTDVVKEQPAGYVEDADGNVTISSTEGLAWLAAKVNGLHDMEPNAYEGKTVTLTADVNLKGYRWNPIGGYLNKDWLGFSGTFDGQGHSVSNIYVNDKNSDKGLFGYVYMGSIKNVNMVGGSVASIFSQTDEEGHSASLSAIGGLVGYAAKCKAITNCHSSVDVYGNEYVGSLCGDVRYDEEVSYISNCSASGTVFGRQFIGGLIGSIYGQIVVRNCFSTGDVNLKTGDTNPWYRGGLIGHSFYATTLNSYSTGTVQIDPENSFGFGKVVGCPEESHIHYIYGQDDINPEMELIGYYCEDISNATLFQHDGNQNTLISSVSVDGKEYSDLTEALGAWVTMQNDPVLKTWTLNSETGYPVFGDAFVPSCNNPTDLVVSNATTVDDGIIQTKLSWNQTGKPKNWEVLYVAAEHDISEGKVVQVTSNPCVLTDIPVGKPLDFYVRAVNSEADKSNWSEPMTYIPDNLHWTEVVTSKPEGYREDSEGNIYISSAEGLAWLSSVVNGMNGAEQSDFRQKCIYIMADIDLSDYRWTPIGSIVDTRLEGYEVNGNNHTISGLYCNDLADYMGLIGYMSNGAVSNLNITQCHVYGENYVGGLIGDADNVEINNCAVSGNVYGIMFVGGIVGYHYWKHIINSSFVGDLVVRRDITKVNTTAGYAGGVCGNAGEDNIVNCYVVCEIQSYGIDVGIITGTCGMHGQVSNCYYKKYETPLPITSDDCNTANNSSFTGSGSTWTLSTPSYVNGAFRSDLVDALNAWVDQNTEGGYYQWVEDTEGYNGGFPIYAQRHFDVGDVVNVVNFTMNEDADADDIATYDMNCDMELNIGDIILVVKAILNQVDNESNKAREFVDLAQYTAVQFEVRVPEGTQVNDIRLVNGMTRSHQVMCSQTSADTYAVVVYSTSNQLLAPEDGRLVELYMAGGCAERMEIKNMTAAKPSGETVRCEIQSDVTGIKVVENREKSERIYDLKGVRHNDTPRNGLYIINGKKTVVK